MRSPEAVIEVIRALDAIDLPYMVVGSISSNTYGIPRSTHDADLVIQLESQPIHELKTRLGTEFRFDPQMSFESITGTMRYLVHAPRLEFTIELFLLSEDEHDQLRFKRRRRITIPDLGGEAWIASAEDVVVTKLRWSKEGKRSKDVEDVTNVIAVSGSTLDWSYIEPWCDRHGTRELLEKIRQSVAGI